MPLYTAITEQDFVSGETKTRIAEEIAAPSGARSLSFRGAGAGPGSFGSSGTAALAVHARKQGRGVYVHSAQFPEYVGALTDRDNQLSRERIYLRDVPPVPR
jgi:hypothetical protein